MAKRRNKVTSTRKSSKGRIAGGLTTNQRRAFQSTGGKNAPYTVSLSGTKRKKAKSMTAEGQQGKFAKRSRGNWTNLMDSVRKSGWTVKNHEKMARNRAYERKHGIRNHGFAYSH